MRAYLAAAATGIQVGAAIAVTRFAIDDIGPFSLAFLRYLIGAACLAPVALMIARVRFERRDILPMAALGIGQFGILIVLMNFGLRTVPAGLGALLFAGFPFMTMILARMLGYEALSVPKTVGVLLCIAGVGVAVALDSLREGIDVGPAGVVYILLSALSGAICSIYYRPYVAKYPPLAVSTLAMAASVLFLVGPAMPEGLVEAVPALTLPAWAAIVFIGVSSAIGYGCWLYALKHLSPTRVTVFLSLGPITGAIMGAVLLREPITVPVMVGCACVAAGLWFTSRPDRM